MTKQGKLILRARKSGVFIQGSLRYEELTTKAAGSEAAAKPERKKIRYQVGTIKGSRLFVTIDAPREVLHAPKEQQGLDSFAAKISAGVDKIISTVGQPVQRCPNGMRCTVTTKERCIRFVCRP